MNPPRKTTGLFLTPRGPYGQRLPERARNHMHASENKIGKAFRKAGRWVKDHVFFGAEGSKSRHEPLEGQGGVGVHFGGGEPSFAGDDKEARDQFISASHGQFVERSLRDKELQNR